MTLPTYPILPPTFLLPDTAFALSTFSTLLLDVYSNYSNYLLFEFSSIMVTVMYVLINFNAICISVILQMLAVT